MKRRALLIVAMALVSLGAWFLFRPELLFLNRHVHEPWPGTQASLQPHTAVVTEPRLLSQGHFHGVAHPTQGTAGIYQLPDGQWVLRLSDFATSNGPDVQVYLIAAPDAHDNGTVTKAGFIPLGALKGNIGDQHYSVPVHTDLKTYQAVTLWCRRFGVNFGTAPLSPQPT